VCTVKRLSSLNERICAQSSAAAFLANAATILWSRRTMNGRLPSEMATSEPSLALQAMIRERLLKSWADAAASISLASALDYEGITS
jgi:hypothetical protein